MPEETDKEIQFSLFSTHAFCYVQDEGCRPLIYFMLPCCPFFLAVQGLSRGPRTVTLWIERLGDHSVNPVCLVPRPLPVASALLSRLLEQAHPSLGN